MRPGYRDRDIDYTRNRRSYLAAEEKKRPGRRVLFACQIVGVILLAFFLVFFFGLSVTVSDYSMGENLSAGQKVLLNRLSYRFWDPQPDDVVLYEAAGTGWQRNTIKRVVAVPGDHVQVIDGYVCVNGDRFPRYEDLWVASPGLIEEDLILGPDQYFIMGDDLAASEDSRYASIGPVTRDQILGKAWIRIRPFGRIK